MNHTVETFLCIYIDFDQRNWGLFFQKKIRRHIREYRFNY